MNKFDCVLPSINKTKYLITDYNAIPGLNNINTKAINDCIEQAYKAGGGIVIVPDGLWLSGPITLKSGIELNLSKNAYLKFIKSKEEFPLIIADYEGQPRIRATSPINAYMASNIAITGHGIIDGSGDLWRPVKENKLTTGEWKRLIEDNNPVMTTHEGGIHCPSQTYYDGCYKGEPDVNLSNALEIASEHYDFYRPVMVSLVHCDKVLIDGVTFMNSPAWNIHPLFCTNFTLRNATVRNNDYAQNGDGIDLESCTNCHIYNSIFDVGDDGICLKSGKNKLAREIKVPTSNVNIHDCTVYHAHGGIVIGSEMSRGINNVSATNLTFIGTDIGIRFKSAIGRGGVVEDILIKNIKMIDIIHEAVIFTMGYQLYTIEHEKEDKVNTTDPLDIPTFKNIVMDNIFCTKAKTALKIDGINPESINNITLKNASIKAKKGYSIERASNIKFKNVNLIDEGNNITVIKTKTINKDVKFNF